MNNKHETVGEYLRRTGYNVTHANTIAKQRDEAIAEAKRNKVLGITGTISTGIASLIIGKRRKKICKQMIDSQTKQFDEYLKFMNERINEIERSHVK